MPLQPEDVTVFLSNHLSSDIRKVEPLSGGGWTQAFGFQSNAEHLVIRFGDYKDDFEKDQAAHQFSSPNLPVPKVLEIGQAEDRHFCISERVFGEMIDTVHEDQMQSLIPAVLDLLDALREADSSKWIEAVGAPSVTWKEQLLSVDEENDRVFGWHDALRDSSIGLEPFEKGLKHLQNNIHVCPNLSHLQHNDLLHQNVLVRNNQIAGVLDWGCAGLGDFLYDLALFTFYAPLFPSMEKIDWKWEAKKRYEELGLDVPNMEERLRCCEINLGLSGMAYTAFRRSWNSAETHARLMLERL